MLARLHLVRHGEVHNPAGVVYSDLPGFPLSPLGREQAAATGEHLADSGATLLVTSPLERARETAGYIARRLALEPVLDAGLTEWGLSLHWSGTPWAELDTTFPGELAAYFDHPADLPFSPESLAQVAERADAVVRGLGATNPGAVAVLVSHQDPIQALRLRLRGDGFTAFHDDKPGHAAVITFERRDGAWVEVGHWAPASGAAFPPPASG